MGEEEWVKKEKETKGKGEEELVGILDGLVAPRLTADTDLSQQKENRAKGLPVPVPLPEHGP